MPEIVLNYDYVLQINTTPEAETGTYADVKKGFDNIAEALNEVVEQSSYLGDGGYGSSEVTGGQLILTLTGKRYTGDPAQDYIFSDAVYYNWGKARKTDARLICPDGSVISCPVTLAKVTRSGGAANSSTAVSVEVHFNGKPAIIDTRLASLQIGSLSLTPAFDPDVLQYTATATSSSDSITAAAQDSNATVAIVNGSASVTSGGDATWVSGKNTVKITVSNESFTRTYTVIVTYNS